MIVYREQSRLTETAQELVRIDATRDPVERLIAIGELEAGVMDALSPECDGDGEVAAALRRAAIRNQTPRVAGLPRRIAISVTEGYRYYALYPEMYRRAALAFARERPGRVAVVGIRSIGTSLSAVVAAALGVAGCEVRSWTVRPRGHPFDRRLRAAPELERRWREMAGWTFAVVDEGPGLSGSSFAAVAEALSALGVPDERIVFFPSWDPEPAQLLSETARRRWTLHRKYLARFEDLGLFRDARDLSGGNWRGEVWSAEREYPAVQPQHERRKYLREGRLYKFAGLGRYGRQAWDRARALAAAGFAPPALALDNGFLEMPWVAGQPAAPGATPELLETMARYLAFLRAEFPCRRSLSPAQLAEMIRVNVLEGLGPKWADRLAPLEVAEAPACAIDNRMFPHEWLRTAAGYVKTDGVEHHDDHFLPGCQDIAWDIAAAQVEFGMNAAQGTEFARRYAQLSGDGTVAARLPFYRLAWLAFRLGYSAMAAAALAGTADGARFERLRSRYAALLRQAMVCHG